MEIAIESLAGARFGARISGVEPLELDESAAGPVLAST